MEGNPATCVAHIPRIETRPLGWDWAGVGREGREKYETNEIFAMKIRIILYCGEEPSSCGSSEPLGVGGRSPLLLTGSAKNGRRRRRIKERER